MFKIHFKAYLFIICLYIFKYVYLNCGKTCIKLFDVYSTEVLSAYILLCKHHRHPPLELSILPKLKLYH